MLALLLAGCPKRQTAKRLIYVPAAPAAATTAPAQQSGVLVIEPPPAPAPSQPAPKPEEVQNSAPPPATPPKHRAIPSETTAPAADAAPPAPAAVAPQLEPAQSAAQQGQLEGKIGSLRDALKQRITRLHQRQLSKNDQKAVEDAELLLSEADQAMHEGDLQQSLNLAQKADLLISAVESGH